MKPNKTNYWKPYFHILLHSDIPWLWYLADFIFGLIISAITVKLPQMTGSIMQGEIFDKGLIGTYVGVTCFSLLLSFFSTVMGSWIGLRTDCSLRKTVWNHILYLPMSIYQKYKPSSLISRVTKDTSSISYGISSCIGIVTNTWTIFLMLKNVYEMNHNMVISMIFVVPWLILVSIVTGRFSFKASQRTQEQFSDFTAVISERLANMKGIKLHSEEETEFEKGRAAAKRQYDAELYRAKVNLFSQPFIYTSEAFLKAFFLIFGGFLISRGELESGKFITIYMYLEMLPVFAIQYIFAYQAVKDSQGASVRAGELLLEETESLQTGEALKTISGDIRFQDVSFRYNDKPILSHATFTIPYGKTTAIVGPSGSGKTTILNLLERFYIPNEGYISYCGKDIRSFRLKDWRSKLCCVSQNTPLLSGTLLKNITYGMKQKLRQGQIEYAAKQAHSYEFINCLPQKFQTETGENGGLFSAGERQRIALTRAFIRNPEFLMLDEAICHLDAVNAAEVYHDVQKQMKSRSCVMVTHDMNTASKADHIIVMDYGTVCGEGTHKYLYETCGTYKKLYHLQNAEYSSL